MEKIIGLVIQQGRRFFFTDIYSKKRIVQLEKRRVFGVDGELSLDITAKDSPFQVAGYRVSDYMSNYALLRPEVGPWNIHEKVAENPCCHFSMGTDTYPIRVMSVNKSGKTLGIVEVSKRATHLKENGEPVYEFGGPEGAIVNARWSFIKGAYILYGMSPIRFGGYRYRQDPSF